MTLDQKQFYDHDYAGGRYAKKTRSSSEKSRWHQLLNSFIAQRGLESAWALEVGCGVGELSDLVANYVGIDISEVVGQFVHRPFSVASATELPFADSSFDVVWSIHVLEHIPQPERALVEMRRVVRNGGYIYLAPAWFCRSWAADGYTVRPYSDFNISGKAIKATIPLRDSLLIRLPPTLFRRSLRALKYIISQHRPTSMAYSELKPNYADNWTSDSDALNAIDPFEVILWFTSRGDTCENYTSFTQAFAVRTGEIIVRVHKEVH